MFFNSKTHKVKLKGRSNIVYEEDGKELLLNCEMMTGSLDLVIYLDSFNSWEYPSNDEEISLTDKERIKSNIIEGLKRNKIVAEWE